MGVWDPGPFDNSAAMEFVDDLSHMPASEATEKIQSVMERVVSNDEFVDKTEMSAALAGASLVAAQIDPSLPLPASVEEQMGSGSFKPEGLRDLSKRVFLRVDDPNNNDWYDQRCVDSKGFADSQTSRPKIDHIVGSWRDKNIPFCRVCYRFNITPEIADKFCGLPSPLFKLSRLRRKSNSIISTRSRIRDPARAWSFLQIVLALWRQEFPWLKYTHAIDLQLRPSPSSASNNQQHGRSLLKAMKASQSHMWPRRSTQSTLFRRQTILYLLSICCLFSNSLFRERIASTAWLAIE